MRATNSLKNLLLQQSGQVNILVRRVYEDVITYNLISHGQTDKTIHFGLLTSQVMTDKQIRKYYFKNIEQCMQKFGDQHYDCDIDLSNLSRAGQVKIKLEKYSPTFANELESFLRKELSSNKLVVDRTGGINIRKS